MTRSLISAAATGVVVLGGLGACTGPSSPPTPATASAPSPSAAAGPASAGGPSPNSGSFPYGGRLVAAWGSATYGAGHVEVAIPAGRAIKLRGRCSGSGVLPVHIQLKALRDDERFPCDAQWQYVFTVFSSDSEAVGPGPYPMVIDGAAGVTSWDLEAYAVGSAASG
ncbi:hypothetical protein [Dactylosporangium sp. CS-033363]|uniref:hypothetical protein n=1 Tax=Dactylosporangium sp. CS-033363 TaxID=3239935 RepID=UPI003D932177